ncbi:MAG: glycosyltransferase family 4 protein [Phycisphaeraceae bacterium]
MRILYVLPFWPHLYTPFLFREMAWMRSRGHAVAVISLRRWPDGQVNVERFGLNDVPVLQISRQYESDRALAGQVARAAVSGGGGRGAAGPTLRQSVASRGGRQGLHEWANWRRIVAFVRQQQSDVMDAHWGAEAAELGVRLKEALGLPLSVTFHGGDIYRPSPALPTIVAAADLLQPVSQFLADLLMRKRERSDAGVVMPALNIDEKRVRIRWHGLPAEVVAATPAAQGDDAQVIATAGRLDPEKGQLALLEAAAPLTGKFPGLRLRIIGGGQLADPLRQRAAELGIADRMEITGALPWDQVLAKMRSAHVYVQCSHYEGFGMTLLEAAAQGLPLIATRTGAHDEIIQDGVNGKLYDVGDAAALAAHLRQLLADTNLRRQMGQASLRRVRERFVVDDLMPRTETALRGLCA